MGYNAEMFKQLRGLGLKPGFRVMDLGSQDVFVGSDDDIECINGFVSSLGGIPFDKHSLVDKPVEAKAVFERAGLEYFRTDVDERPSTIYVDFNKLVFPAAMRDTVDLVVNIGTTEHLSNPIGGFAMMHYVAKPGAILFHDVPLFGWGNHGLLNATPKFWHALTWMNAYERISAAVCRTDETSIDPANFYHEYLDYMEGLDRARGISWMIRIILRKTRSGAFVSPFDAALPLSKGEKEANLLWGALYPFMKTGVWTRKEINSTIDDFLSMVGKSFRTRRTPLQSLIQRMKSAARPLLK
jgi:hypothetical protein